MGNWSISIRGVGPHENGRPYDVEQIAADLTDKLREAGHNVTSATVTIGGEVNVADRKAGLLPLKIEQAAE